MEMNPFTLDAEGKPFPLDMRGELDDTAYFKSGKKWGDVEFPLPFGRSMSAAEVRLPPHLAVKLICVVSLSAAYHCLWRMLVNIEGPYHSMAGIMGCHSSEIV
jgi:hypothetical protein